MRSRRFCSTAKRPAASCEFIDSTVIRTLLDKRRQLETDGHRLELLVPSEGKLIRRVLDVSGLRLVLTVHGTIPSS